MNKSALFFSAMVLSASMAFGTTITVNSSTATKFLDSGGSGDFSASFTAADFLAARTGSAAVFLPETPYWISSLPSAPAALWVGTNSSAATSYGDTALYATSFNLTGPVTNSAFTLAYAVDNQLGGSNDGIYLNGKALPSSSGIGDFHNQYTYQDNNITSDLVSGTNWLYIDAVNLGGPAGLIFSSDITTAAAPVPEPADYVMCLSGLFILCFGIYGPGRKSARRYRNT